MKIAILTLAMCLLLTLGGRAQLRAEQQIAGFSNPDDYSVKYDKFKERTTVLLHGTALKAMDGSDNDCIGRLVVGGAFSFPGQTLDVNIEQFGLFFFSTSRDWCFLKSSRSLIIIADSKKITFNNGVRDSDLGRGQVTETLAYWITRNDLKAIASAKSVDMQLGQYELSMTPETIKAFANFLSLGTK